MTQVVSELDVFLIDVTAEMSNTVVTRALLTFIFNAGYFIAFSYFQFPAYHVFLC